MAVSRDPVGVDLERMEPLPDLDSVAVLCLAEAEARYMARLPPAQRAGFFYRCWTRKEACLKALGCGLTRDPRSVDTLAAGAWHWSEPALEAGYVLSIASAVPIHQSHAYCA